MSERKRGREAAADMVRSLGLLMVVVVPVWYFAQAPDSDVAELRVVDTATDLRAFAADEPEALVPGPLPEGWRPTSSRYEGGTSLLRIGYVTPDDQYAEYAASQAPRQEFVEQVAGEDVEQLADVVVDGVAWQQLREPDGSTSLVRTVGGVTVVVGSLRATAELAELEVLLGALRPAAAVAD